MVAWLSQEIFLDQRLSTISVNLSSHNVCVRKQLLEFLGVPECFLLQRNLVVDIDAELASEYSFPEFSGVRSILKILM